MDGEWAFASIGDLARARGERVMPAADSDAPYVGLEHIEAETGRLVGVGRAGDTVSLKTPFEVGDILYGKLRPALRKVLRAPICGVASTEILAIVASRPTDAAFLEQVLHSDQVLAWALQGAEGTKMPRTSWERLSRYQFLCPPAEERVAIGQTLDAIDEAIEKTEAVIAATEDLRKALLQELLTRGLPGLHTDWKTVPGIGTIPACWEAVKLEAICDHITKGATPTTFGHAWAEDPALGLPFLRSECVGDGEFLPSGLGWITPAARTSLARAEVRAGDILMTITGYVGRVCRVPASLPNASINQHIARIRVRAEEIVSPEFAYRALRVPRITDALREEITGIAYPQIGLAQVRALAIPAPSSSEQEAVVAVLDAVDSALVSEQAELAQLKASKAAVADALLSGRVRVPIGEGVPV